jgi:nitroreductase
MSFDEVVRTRRSIRRFRPDDVPESTATELLDLARHAPSSMNGQPWHFVLVRSPETRARLAEIKNRFCPPEKRHFKADFIRAAPLIIVVCVDQDQSHGRGLENGILATATLLLAARRRGLGTVYMSAYIPDEPALSDEIRQLLGIPPGVAPVTMIPVGYPAETPAPKDLRPLEGMVHREKF